MEKRELYCTVGGNVNRYNLVENSIGCVCSVVSDNVSLHGWEPARLLCPCDSPGKNTELDYHFLLQGILPAQGSNLYLPHLLALGGRFFFNH